MNRWTYASKLFNRRDFSILEGLAAHARHQCPCTGVRAGWRGDATWQGLRSLGAFAGEHQDTDLEREIHMARIHTGKVDAKFEVIAMFTDIDRRHPRRSRRTAAPHQLNVSNRHRRASGASDRGFEVILIEFSVCRPRGRAPPAFERRSHRSHR